MVKRNKTLLIIGIVLLAACMRTPITALGALTEVIRQDLMLGAAVGGLFTTITALVFALSSAAMARAGEKFGLNRVLAFGLLLMIIGQWWRLRGSLFDILLGTAILALGISSANVLLPSLIKTSFPLHIGLLTSIYTALMSGMAGISGGLALPLAEQSGWHFSLSVWIWPPVVTFVLWLFLSREKLLPVSTVDHTVTSGKINLYKNKLAWAVTFYMGLQSLIYYTCVAWMPSVLLSRGIAVESVGWMVFLFQLFNVPGAFFASLIAERFREQNVVNLISGLFYVIGPLSLLFAPVGWMLYLGVMILGLGGGSTIALAMHLFSIRTRDGVMAGRLSGMAQTVGYLLATLGPVGLGLIYDVSSSWYLPILLLALTGVVLMYFGWQSGKYGFVEDDI